MLVPKLVCEASDASGPAWFASVHCAWAMKSMMEAASYSEKTNSQNFMCF
jgi:hypothetical protein